MRSASRQNLPAPAGTFPCSRAHFELANSQQINRIMKPSSKLYLTNDDSIKN